MAENQAFPGRSEPVEVAGRVVGYTVRLSMAEVQAVLIGADAWDRPDLALGVFRRRQQARRAVLDASRISENGSEAGNLACRGAVGEGPAPPPA